MRALVFAFGMLASAIAVAQQPAAAPVAKPAAERRVSDATLRDAPVRCKAGDRDYAQGRSLGRIFGAAWPAAPAAAKVQRAEAFTLGRVDWPSDRGAARAVSAVLVDAQGKPLRAVVLCASVDGADAAVEKAAMAGTYRAATFDGVPATSVAMVAWRLGEARPAR